MGRESVGQNCAVSQTLLFRADATIGKRFYLLRCMSLVLAHFGRAYCASSCPLSAL